MPVDKKDFSSYLLRTRHELKDRFKLALRETRTPQSVAYNAFSAWLLTHAPEVRRELLTQMIACLDPADLEDADILDLVRPSPAAGPAGKREDEEAKKARDAAIDNANAAQPPYRPTKAGGKLGPRGEGKK